MTFSQREKMEDVRAIKTMTMTFELNEGQCWYKTPGAYEIWQENPLQRIKRIPRKRIFWVISK